MDLTTNLVFETLFGLMEYNGMKRNEIEYNNVPLFGFEK
jgi:hypothetical protein